MVGTDIIRTLESTVAFGEAADPGPAFYPSSVCVFVLYLQKFGKRSIPCKHEDLHLDPQHACKRLVEGHVHVCHPSSGEAEKTDPQTHVLKTKVD